MIFGGSHQIWICIARIDNATKERKQGGTLIE
jgi:hypothetical protein